MSRAGWIRLVAVTAFGLCLAVVVLGAYVRSSAAGLGCPDWPGCYGHLTPAAAAADAGTTGAVIVETGKAWREMVHRYAAGTLGVLIVAIAALAIQSRRPRLPSVPFAIALLLLVVAQAALGRLTVTWRLQPLIVTSHLLLGLCTLSLLWWLVLNLLANPRDGAWHSGGALHSPAICSAQMWALLGLVVLVLQLALGGWTSSNYAAIACPDLPTCQNQWWPPADFASGFHLWRDAVVNFEGGVLSLPARVAIQLAHRLGAVLTAVALVWSAICALGIRSTQVRQAAWAVLGLLLLQLLIGSAMVLRGFPLWLATAHNAGAALLLLATVALNRALRPS